MKIMAEQTVLETNMHPRSVGSKLAAELKTISEKCTNCQLCIEDCGFLKTYGTPKEIADAFDFFDKKSQILSFECSLCQLCAAVCPEKIDPSEMFVEMRREAVRLGNADLPEHAGLLKYEKRGTSRRYTWYGLPKNCDTIFFPGCTLPGTRPDKTIKLYEYMRAQIPTLGIVLDCCTKPSHDLGREVFFNAMFGEMKNFLVKNNIRDVYVACPSCYKVFNQYGEALSVKTVYELLAKNGSPSKDRIKQTVSIQDPCAVRFDKQIHTTVRELALKQGLTIEEMPHCKETTFCCGEGGAVNCVSPGFARGWGNQRKKEVNNKRMVTYCAGCTHFLDPISPTTHILDLLFEPETALDGKAKVAKSPITYVNRLILKYRLKRSVNALVTREREFTGVVR